MLEQRGYQLDHAAARLFKPGFVVLDLLYAFELEVTLRIVFVGSAYVIGQRFEPSRS